MLKWAPRSVQFTIYVFRLASLIFIAAYIRKEKSIRTMPTYYLLKISINNFIILLKLYVQWHI